MHTDIPAGLNFQVTPGDVARQRLISRMYDNRNTRGPFFYPDKLPAMPNLRGLMGLGGGNVDITPLVVAINSDQLSPQYQTGYSWHPPHLPSGVTEELPSMFAVDGGFASQSATLLGGSVSQQPAVREGMIDGPNVPFVELPGGGNVNAAAIAQIFKTCNSCPAFHVTPQTAIDALTFAANNPLWSTAPNSGTTFSSGPVSTLTPAQQEAVNQGLIQGTPCTPGSPGCSAPTPVYVPPASYTTPPVQGNANQVNWPTVQSSGGNVSTYGGTPTYTSGTPPQLTAEEIQQALAQAQGSGGSGGQTTTDTGKDNTMLYVGLGAAAILLVVMMGGKR